MRCMIEKAYEPKPAVTVWGSCAKVLPTLFHNCIRNVTFRKAYMFHTFKGRISWAHVALRHSTSSIRSWLNQLWLHWRPGGIYMKSQNSPEPQAWPWPWTRLGHGLGSSRHGVNPMLPMVPRPSARNLPTFCTILGRSRVKAGKSGRWCPNLHSFVRSRHGVSCELQLLEIIIC